MTKEDKELLLKDLSARLPYGVICQYNCVIPCDRRVIVKANAKDVLKGIIPMSDGHIGFMVGIDKINALEGDIKPYLRSLSSMTEEERKDMGKIVTTVYGGTVVDDDFVNVIKYIDWLNEHHFDYRNLIGKGLALEAPEEIYEK